MPPPLRRRIFFSLVPFGSPSQVFFSGEFCFNSFRGRFMLGQRRTATHAGCAISHSNPPYPHAQLTTHMSSAICTCVTVPPDSHMWTDRTDSMRVLRGALEAHRIFVHAWSRRRLCCPASLCIMHDSLVCLYVHLCGPCVSRAARRLTMATEPPAMIITIVVSRD